MAELIVFGTDNWLRRVSGWSRSQAKILRNMAAKVRAGYTAGPARSACEQYAMRLIAAAELLEQPYEANADD